MADGTIDRIQVVFETNYKEFTSGLDKMEMSVENASKEMSGLETASNGVGENLEETGNTAKKAGQNVEEFGNSAKKAGNEAKDAGGKAEQAGKNIEKSGNNAKSAGGFATEAKAAFTALKGALGAIGVTVGITELISKLQELYDSIIAARDEVDKLNQDTLYTLKLNEEENELAHNVAVKSVLTTVAGKEYINAAQTAAGHLISTNPELMDNTEMLQKLTDQFTAYAKTSGTQDMNQFMGLFVTTMGKFNMDVSEWGNYLEYISSREVSGKINPYGVSTEELLQTVYAGAGAATGYLNTNIYRATDYLASSGANWDDASAGYAGLENIIIKMLKDVSESEKVKLAGEQTSEWWQDIVKKAPNAYEDAVQYLIKKGIDETDAETLAKELKSKNPSKSYSDALGAVFKEKAAELANSIELDDDYMEEWFSGVLAGIMKLDTLDENSIQNLLIQKYGFKSSSASEFAKAITASDDGAELLLNSAKKTGEDMTNIWMDGLEEGGLVAIAQRTASAADYDATTEAYRTEQKANSDVAKRSTQESIVYNQIYEQSGNEFLAWLNMAVTKEELNVLTDSIQEILLPLETIDTLNKNILGIETHLADFKASNLSKDTMTEILKNSGVDVEHLTNVDKIMETNTVQAGFLEIIAENTAVKEQYDDGDVKGLLSSILTEITKLGNTSLAAQNSAQKNANAAARQAT